MENSQNMDNLTEEAFKIIRDWQKLTIIEKIKRVSPAPSPADKMLVKIYLDKKEHDTKTNKIY